MRRLTCWLRGHLDFPARIGRDEVVWQCDRCGRLDVTS